MSDSDSNAIIASEAQQLFADTAIVYALAALMAYEYVLTFHREVVVIWPRGKRSGPAWLFIINRYLLILATVLACAPSPSVHRFVDSHAYFKILTTYDVVATAQFGSGNQSP
ncbi:hypothetical protein NM688_g2034 [Phlebia brevispora]|uniref:Uncharacterized protein n=1 Tax=Phlebia brevispora TaxID=194682 RepID=A0ACC1TA32_9APHY|nr:hypothetical protein NM688_g2034 [Phlebia brevispora]